MKRAASCSRSPVETTQLPFKCTKTCAPSSTMTARYSSGRVCTSTSSLHPVSQLLNTFKSTACFLFVRRHCNAIKSLSDFFTQSKDLEQLQAVCLLWIWRRYSLRAARGSQRNPYVIHGHGAAGGCCCCSLQIAAHLALSSQPVQEGDVFFNDHSLFLAEEDSLLLCVLVLGIKSSVEQQPQHSHSHACTGTDATVQSDISPSKCVRAWRSVWSENKCHIIKIFKKNITGIFLNLIK